MAGGPKFRPPDPYCPFLLRHLHRGPPLPPERDERNSPKTFGKRSICSKYAPCKQTRYSKSRTGHAHVAYSRCKIIIDRLPPAHPRTAWGHRTGLVGINALNVGSAGERNRGVLVVTLAVAKNGKPCRSKTNILLTQLARCLEG